MFSYSSIVITYGSYGGLEYPLNVKNYPLMLTLDYIELRCEGWNLNTTIFDVQVFVIGDYVEIAVALAPIDAAPIFVAILLMGAITLSIKRTKKK